MIPRRERGPGGDPGDPKDCGLSTLASAHDGGCSGEYYRTIANVRMCRKHWDLVQAIARDAPKVTRGRKPDTLMMRRVAA